MAFPDLNLPFLSCVILSSYLTSLNFNFLMGKVVVEVVVIT